MKKVQSGIWLVKKFILESYQASHQRTSIFKVDMKELIIDFPAWLLSQRKTDLAYLPQNPWLPYSVSRKLTKLTNKNIKIFEYGTGSSTCFFLKRGCEVISVEHDPNWFELVTHEIERRNLNNWQGFLKIPDPLFYSREYELFQSSKLQYKSCSFESYVKTIQQFPDNYFDIILIDGRARTSCFQFALPKVKETGLIIWDNVERGEYHIHQLIENPKYSVEVIGGPTPGVNFFTWTAFITKN